MFGNITNDLGDSKGMLKIFKIFKKNYVCYKVIKMNTMIYNISKI